MSLSTRPNEAAVAPPAHCRPVGAYDSLDSVNQGLAPLAIDLRPVGAACSSIVLSTRSRGSRRRSLRGSVRPMRWRRRLQRMRYNARRPDVDFQSSAGRSLLFLRDRRRTMSGYYARVATGIVALVSL